MPAVSRRVLLTCGAVVGTTSLVGCLGEDTDDEEDTPTNTTEGTPQEREYDAENPFPISLVNDGGLAETVEIEISRNGDEIFADTLEVDADERITVAEYETTGRYAIRAETGEHQMETYADIERENLMSHRAAFGDISVYEDGVLIRVWFED